MYYTSKQLEELEKEVKTIPVDGDGHALSVGYSDEFVRGTVLKLIADLNEQKSYIATIVNSYHHVLSYGLAQEGVRLVNGVNSESTEQTQAEREV